MRKILLIDDERDLLEIMSEALAVEKFEVHTATCGASALRKLQEESGFHLALCDLTMPTVDGRGVLREMLISYPQIPVAVVTAHFETETIIETMKLGAVDYLIKPVPLDKLVEKVYSLSELGESRQRLYAGDSAAGRYENVLREARFRLRNAIKTGS